MLGAEAARPSIGQLPRGGGAATLTGTLTGARQVADAVLFEGCLLPPCEAESPEDRVRWQFGVLGPQGAAQAGVGEPPSLAAEVLLQQSPDATVDVHLRFLQVQARTVERWTDGAWHEVAVLPVRHTRWTPFHEAVPRELSFADLQVAPQELTLEVPGGTDVQELREHGFLVGRLVRRRWPLRGRLLLRPRPGADPRLTVLGLEVVNGTDCSTGALPGSSARDVAARGSFVGTHLLLTAQDARFVSLLDGPDWAEADARSCAQDRCWAVLVADDAGADAVLIAPVVLGDHPTMTPEGAPATLDAIEAEQILTMRMVMTVPEQAQPGG